MQPIESRMSKREIIILYASETGKSHKLATTLSSKLGKHHIKCFDDHFLSNTNQFLIIITSTYFDGKPPTNGKILFEQLKDLYNDFRVERNYFKNTMFCVFGVGNRAYEKDFCLVARDMRYMLKKLGANEVIKGVFADEYSCLEDSFERWSARVFEISSDPSIFSTTSQRSEKLLNGSVSEFGTVKGLAHDFTESLFSDLKIDSRNIENDNHMDNQKDQQKCPNNLVSVSRSCHCMTALSENQGPNSSMVLGEVLSNSKCCHPGSNRSNESEPPFQQKTEDPSTNKSKISMESPPTADFSDDDTSSEDISGIADIEDIGKKMLTPLLSKNLQKQGYHLVGTHSAVKLCRWTKSMLRGHGGCYKHTFYGISSLSCMEVTPSLACANKCVFCWRHYTNPVAKKWMWEADQPEKVFDGLVEGHRSFVKQLKYSPGVTPQALERAMSIQHCALSLVGEPIMYPYISELLDLLHKNGISSFLVTNAQFPDLLKSLKSPTQLYLSIDAANSADLREIDRPLHSDYWERLLKCVDIIRNRKERTVFRLTLVKGKNNLDFDGYKELIGRGLPDFVEVKGVTFCGYKNKAEMSMQNVPFHREVVEFCQKIVVQGYEIACVHEHSCCVLIANQKFKINGMWNTWIDYDKFFEIKDSDVFDGLAYSTVTPPWSLFGSSQKGFDPALTPKVRVKKAKS